MEAFVDLRAHVVSNVLLYKNLPDFQEFVLPLRLNTPVTIQWHTHTMQILFIPGYVLPEKVFDGV